MLGFRARPDARHPSLDFMHAVRVTSRRSGTVLRYGSGTVVADVAPAAELVVTADGVEAEQPASTSAPHERSETPTRDGRPRRGGTDAAVRRAVMGRVLPPSGSGVPGERPVGRRRTMGVGNLRSAVGRTGGPPRATGEVRMSQTELVSLGDDVRLEVLVTGPAPEVVLLPSANRSASDFAQLSADLAAAGIGSVAVNPRGVAGSTGPTDELSMRDLADDVAGVVDRYVGGPAHLVGHALGNTIARATATFRPTAVRSVSLLACGGHDMGRRTPSSAVMEAFARCHHLDLPPTERVAALGTAFFAEGNDPSPWLEGWYPGGQVVAEALRRSDWREWYLAGRTPVLIVQPTEDQMAPIEVGQELAAEMGGRARYVELAHCGHAILPEQPVAVAEYVLTFLADQEPTTGTAN